MPNLLTHRPNADAQAIARHRQARLLDIAYADSWGQRFVAALHCICAVEVVSFLDFVRRKVAVSFERSEASSLSGKY